MLPVESGIQRHIAGQVRVGNVIKGWQDVSFAGVGLEHGEIELGDMGGLDSGSIGDFYGDGVAGEALIEHRA